MKIQAIDAEWRGELGEYFAIRETEELERVGGVKAQGYLDLILSSSFFASSSPWSAAFVNHFTASS